MSERQRVGRRQRYSLAARAAVRSLRTPSPPTWELAAPGDASFEGQTVVITGAGGMIGRRVLAAFLAEGATVHGLDSSADACAGLTSSIGGGVGERLQVHHGDVTDPTVLDDLAISLGQLDAVLHLAGVNVAFEGEGPLLVDDWLYSFEVNVVAVARATDRFLPLLRASHGSVVVTTSVHAEAASPWPVYGTAKAALSKWVDDAAAALAPEGVRVNAVAPGFVQPADAPIDRRALTHQPLGGGAVPAEAIAHAMLFLADRRRSPMTTGQHLRIDGGNALGRPGSEFLHPGFRS